MTTKTEAADPEAGADEKVIAAAPVDNDQDEGDEPSLEDLALEAGWTPKDKWRGDPGKHVGAAEFLRRTAKSQKSLASKLAQAEQAIEDTQKETDKRFKRLERSMNDRQKAELDTLRDQYEAKLQDAIDSGDPKAIREAMKERDEALDDLEEPEKTEEDLSDDEWLDTKWSGPAFPALQKDFWGDHAWVLLEDDDNSVFGDVEEMITGAVMALTDGKRAVTLREYDEILETADKWLRKKHKARYEAKTADDGEDEPEEKPAKAAAKPPANGKRVPVLADGHRTRSTSAASRLSPEEAAEADRCIKAGLYASRDEWAQVYYGANA